MNGRNLDNLLIGLITAFILWLFFKPSPGAYVFSEEWEVKVPTTPQPRPLRT